MTTAASDILRRAIRAARRRVRLHRLALAAAAVLPVALGLCLVWLLARQFFAIPATLALAGVLAFAAGAISYLVWATVRRTDDFSIALSIDRRANLADRTSSATEFLARAARTEFHAAQIRDAERSLAGLAVAPLFPFDTRGLARRLLVSVLLAPLLYAAWALDLAGLFDRGAPTAAEEARREFAEAPAALPAPALEEVGLSQEMLALIHPAEELIQRWKERLRTIEERKAGEAPAPEEPPAEPALPQVIQTRGGLFDQLPRDVAPDMGAQQMRLSDVKALADRQADGEYADAFAYLDQKLFGEGGEKLEAVQRFAEQMSRDSQKQQEAGKGLVDGGLLAAQDAVESDKQGALMNQIQGAQLQSMADFLAEYAEHLLRMTGKMNEIIEQARKLDEKTKGDRIYKERYNLVNLGQATRPLSELTAEDLKDARVRKLSPEEAGGSAAGVGFGTPEGEFKVPKVEKEASLYAELDSQFGEGAALQILQDLADGNAARYAALFREYAAGAEAILNDEDIPLAIKNYVREYFLAISPAQITGDPDEAH